MHTTTCSDLGLSSVANVVPAITWLENERVWVWQAHSACKRAKMKGGRALQTAKNLPGRQNQPSCRPVPCSWTPAAKPRRVGTEKGREPREAPI